MTTNNEYTDSENDQCYLRNGYLLSIPVVMFPKKRLYYTEPVNRCYSNNKYCFRKLPFGKFQLTTIRTAVYNF